MSDSHSHLLFNLKLGLQGILDKVESDMDNLLSSLHTAVVTSRRPPDHPLPYQSSYQHLTREEGCQFAPNDMIQTSFESSEFDTSNIEQADGNTTLINDAEPVADLAKPLHQPLIL